jgi:hypothetical protein
VLWCGDFFGYGVHDDDALALGGLFLAIVMVILACYGLSCCYLDWLGFYLLLSFVIQAQDRFC